MRKSLDISVNQGSSVSLVSKMSLRRFVIAVALLAGMAMDAVAQAPVDPGPRPIGTFGFTSGNRKIPGSATVFDLQQPHDPSLNGAGGPLNSSNLQAAMWFSALGIFGTVATVNGTATGSGPVTSITGLGPAFNGESCLQCHAFPTIGGSSPPSNPQFRAATNLGGRNTIPSFLSPTGPVREARFINAVPAFGEAAAVPAGAVAPLFVIAGRSDAPPGCTINQPDFPTQIAANNVSFRIPIPLYGEGYVENVPDAVLQANLANEINLSAHPPSGVMPTPGILGSFNTNPNDNTISRFGWKAQNKSLLLFAAEAYNVEMGVTNDLFPNERSTGIDCIPNTTPEDVMPLLNNIPAATLTSNPGTNEISSEVSTDIQNFLVFMRINAAPGQCAFNSGVVSSTGQAQCLSLTSTTGTNANTAAAVASIQDGKALFGSIVPAPTAPNTGIGCVLCHTDSLTTGPSSFGSLNNATFHPYSDFALHNMGSGLSDGITQGAAGPSQFRTAPLWGIGQRLFFLHDGRTSDLNAAIQAHCTGTGSTSEACNAVKNYNSLKVSQQQDILNFLRSL
ncbi:MAG TPA: di-heme oxidoredictase family protein [Candidatus Angelobacter sp.]|nr:di-heme oxidoredictase family protein [Candidatus Angelobacter sp.]